MDKNNSSNVDKYINGFSKDIQTRMESIRQVIHEVSPDVEEMIRYKMASFKLGEGSYVYLAGFKNHISFYPFPSGNEEFEELAKDYNTSGKGTIQFPNDDEIPLELVRKLVEYWQKKQGGKSLYN